MRSQGGIVAGCVLAALLLCGFAMPEAQAAKMIPLTDAELDAIYAEGLVIELDVDIAISEGAEVVSNVSLDQIQQLVADGFQLRRSSGPGTTIKGGALLDPAGAAVVVNPVNLGGILGGSLGASDWSAPTGIDIDVIGGDVAVGINIAVFVNSVLNDSSLYQFNFNFTDPGDLLNWLLP